MKIRVGDLKRLIIEGFNDTSTLKIYDPSHWGLEDTEVSRRALRAFVDAHAKPVNMGPEQGTEAEHIMLVDDMEGMGVRDALEAGDLAEAEQLAQQVLQLYTPEDYDAFANDFHGTDPKRGPGRGN